jgi:hypothetical protein
MRPLVAAFVLALSFPTAALAQEAAEAPRPSFFERMRARMSAPEEGAASWQLVPAVLVSYGAGATDNFGAGASLRLHHLPSGLPLRIGGFLTGEVMADGAMRVAGGLEGGMSMMGCQIGLAWRTGTEHNGLRWGGSLGLHIGKTFDLGPIAIGGRLTIPLYDQLAPNEGTTRVQGVEGQVVLSVGPTLGLDGTPRRGCGCPHRRPASEAPVAIEEGAAAE